MKAAAQVCRYCGAEFDKGAPREATVAGGVGRAWFAGLGAVALALMAALLAWNMRSREAEHPVAALNSEAPRPVEQSASEPGLEELLVGSTLDWNAGEAPDELLRGVGPYRVRITKVREDELVAPVVELTSSGQTVRMEGERSSPGYSHQISAVQLLRGAAPIVMLQSFSGGAHCCNVVKLAGFTGGKLRVIELGSWDGDTMDLPKDISGDGHADFRFVDNSFLYAFASYASSRAPPLIINVREGKVVDVSKGASFRSLFREEMESAEAVCTSGTSGDERNGACPSYVAAAAQVGKLGEAWQRMVASYDATTDWDFPAGCRVAGREDCPPGAEIRFKSYPEALLNFLKERGYVPKEWLPPEQYQPALDSEQEPRAPDTETI